MFIFFLASCRINGNKSPDKPDGSTDKIESQNKDDDKEIDFDKDNIDISGYYKLRCPENKNHKLKIIVETGLIEVRETYVK